tara:strand:+ start:10447 stop:11529 length:1083 start_codon:yes stop_codon:yes gene_type:complete
LKRKILIIIGSLDIGGTEKQLLKIISRLTNYFDFTILSFIRGGDLLKDYKKLGIEVLVPVKESKRIIPLRILGYIYTIFKSFIKTKPSIVHFYLPHSYLLGSFLAYIFPQKKYIMSRRSLNYYQEKIPFCKFIEKKLHKKMNLIITNSKKNYNQLVNEENVKPDKCHIISNGIEIVNKKKKENKIVEILCIANFIKYKNHNMIIEACNRLSNKLEWSLKLVGNDTDKIIDELKSRIKFENKSKINFIKKNKSISKFLIKADIGILTSNEEGLSNSILEYMSYGIPVIATNIGGNVEQVFNKKNGFLVEKNNDLQLSIRLEELIKNKSLRHTLGKESKRIAMEKFSMEKSFRKYKKIYEEI